VAHFRTETVPCVAIRRGSSVQENEFLNQHFSEGVTMNANHMDQGYIYALINQSLGGLVKVGKTGKSPEERAQELSSATGIPTPFFVAYKIYVNDCSQAEEMIHILLQEKGCRCTDNREFFNAPLNEIIEIMHAVERMLSDKVDDASDDRLSRFEAASDGTPWQALLDEARKYVAGDHETLQDIDKALGLFKKAAKLGSIEAYLQLGEIYSSSCEYGAVFFEPDNMTDYKMALNYLREGAEKNKEFSGLCYQTMAGIHMKIIRNPHNCRLCWQKYFEHEDFKNGYPGGERQSAAMRYIQNMLELGLPINDKYIQILTKQEIRSLYKETRRNAARQNLLLRKANSYLERFMR
jgi:hypothetical protein